MFKLNRSLTLMVAAVLFSPLIASADGLFYRLPDDGGWAKFDVQFQTLDQNGDIQSNLIGSLTVSSVGHEMLGEGECRWIELKRVLKPDGGPDEIELHKLLIPEKWLVPGERPLDHVIQAWTKFGGIKNPRTGQFEDWATAAPRALKGLHLKSLQSNTDLHLFLAGRLKETRELDEKTMESALGKLPCAGVLGEYFNTDETTRRETRVRIETRLHKDAPFGVVTLRWECQHSVRGKPQHLVQILTLKEIGKNAKSEVPDAR